MERNGWIGHAGSDDLRERGYRLTATGQTLLKAARPAWKRAQNRLRTAMPENQWNAMWRTFGAISEAARHVRGAARKA